MTRAFSVASDEALISLIEGSRARLVVIAPALNRSVAEALAKRLEQLGHLDITVILDSDPEVYRLGFGDLDALEIVRTASAANHFDLREQPGVRIGIVISDATTMVYAPVSKNIEAGSTSIEKPNALILTGEASNIIASAAGADPATDKEREIGSTALDPAKVEAMQSNLKANPPKPFDITRKLNVFSSKVQYVEFTASKYRLTARHVPLPPELVDVADEDLRDRITSRIRAPFEGIGKVEVTFNHGGKSETLNVDDDWLNKERRRIEDRYTYQINNFGRVILFMHRSAFDKEVSRFKTIIEAYQKSLRQRIIQEKQNFINRIIDEYIPRWTQNPPESITMWGIAPTDETILKHLTKLAEETFETAISFEPPTIRVLYKNVSSENINDSAFLEVLKSIMTHKRVPPEIISSLFESDKRRQRVVLLQPDKTREVQALGVIRGI